MIVDVLTGARLWHVETGDALEVLRGLPPNVVDSIVTDPPSAIGFMGLSWDSDKGGREAWIPWLASIMAEALRVLKPGGHALVWALPRSSHWTATALELAGFEIRDCISHVNATGFPKSLDISKEIDRQAGAARTVIERTGKWSSLYAHDGNGRPQDPLSYEATVTEPATDLAKQWAGFGSALKPAFERWFLCQKPSAKYAAARSALSPRASGDARSDSVRWLVAASSTIKSAATSTAMDTSEFPAVATTILNIASSWQLTLAALCDAMSTCTIETESSMITALKILSCSLSRLTRESTPESLPSSESIALANTAAAAFSDLQALSFATLTHSALSNAVDEANSAGISGSQLLTAEPAKAAASSEDWWLVRKPIEETTLAAQVLKTGTGALNIDASRVEGSGNWPAHLLFSHAPECDASTCAPHCPIRILDGQATGNATPSAHFTQLPPFYYTPKPSRREREAGCEGLPLRTAGEVTGGRADGSAGLRSPRAGAGRTAGARNHHPTLKSIALMRWLCRLITPPGGVVLDCFAGAGSTGVAALAENFRFVGIEESADYVEIARARIIGDQPLLNQEGARWHP